MNLETCYCGRLGAGSHSPCCPYANLPAEQVEAKLQLAVLVVLMLEIFWTPRR